jgi:nitronate monooxygenase
MRWNNIFTREYGVDLPFVGAGMAMISGPELVAAVSEAGGLGILGTGPLPPALMRAQVRDVRHRTRGPFGVNLIIEQTTLGAASTAAHIDVCIEERVSPVVFFWNLPPSEWIARLHGAGLKVWATVSSHEDAAKALPQGFDALIVQGAEAGGHVRAQLGLVTLVPAVRDLIGDLPLIAAGGIADGRGAAAALTLGADAVCVGTRLIASRESAAREDYKARVVAARSSDTVVTRLFGPEWPDAPMRVILNRAVEEGGPARPDVSIGDTQVFGQHYVLPHHSALLPTRDTRGDLEQMCLAAGASAGLVGQISSAGEIVRSVMSEAATCLRRCVDELT